MCLFKTHLSVLFASLGVLSGMVCMNGALGAGYVAERLWPQYDDTQDALAGLCVLVSLVGWVIKRFDRDEFWIFRFARDTGAVFGVMFSLVTFFYAEDLQPFGIGFYLIRHAAALAVVFMALAVTFTGLMKFEFEN